MRRSLRRLLPLVAVVSLVAVAPPSPAHADVGVCSGLYQLDVPPGLGWPVLHAAKSANFEIRMTLGTCSPAVAMTLTGALVGTCWSATGLGTTSNDHDFAFEWIGWTITFTGAVTGQLHISNANAATPCTTGSAHQFDLHGALAH